MALVAPKTAPKRAAANRVKQNELAVDNYPCRVAQVVDMGRHHKEVWNDITKKFEVAYDKAPVHLLRLTYEFTTEFMKDEAGNELEDKPRWLSEEFALYALDNDLATSTKRMSAFDPGFTLYGGDWEQVLTMPCAVTIAHKKSGAAKVGNVAKPMKGMVVAELKNEPKVFSLDAPDLDVFRSFPEWIQERIKANLDFEGSKLQAALTGQPVGEAKKEEKVAEKPVQEAVEPNIVEEDDSDSPW
jgi:hypothetical protein